MLTIPQQTVVARVIKHRFNNLTVEEVLDLVYKICEELEKIEAISTQPIPSTRDSKDNN